MAQIIISTLLLNLMSVTEVSEMARLFNEAFQCLVIYNLDFWETYDRIFHLLCLQWRFLTLEGALETTAKWERHLKAGGYRRVYGFFSD